MAKAMGLLREYSNMPDPDAYTPEELGIIWLYSTCLEECWEHPMFMFTNHYVRLTDYLVDCWKHFPTYLKGAIPFDAVDGPDTSCIDWCFPFNMKVTEHCMDYALLMEKRYAVQYQDVSSNSASHGSVQIGFVGEPVSSLR